MAGSGKLVLPTMNSLGCRDSSCPTGDNFWVPMFSGFATTFEILQTFTPPTSAVGFTVPYMPEGMAGADSFDTYWGPLAKPLDFTQAHPLKCDYPAAAPHVGDYLTVPDTVPTPRTGARRLLRHECDLSRRDSIRAQDNGRTLDRARSGVASGLHAVG